MTPTLIVTLSIAGASLAALLGWLVGRRRPAPTLQDRTEKVREEAKAKEEERVDELREKAGENAKDPDRAHDGLVDAWEKIRRGE